MDKDTALDLALEALEYFSDTSPTMAGKAHAEDAITAIKQARSAPVQKSDLIARLKHPEDHYELTDPKKSNAVLMSLCQEAADALAAPVQDNDAHYKGVVEGVQKLFDDKRAQRQWVEVEQVKWDGEKFIAKLKENT